MTTTSVRYTAPAGATALRLPALASRALVGAALAAVAVGAGFLSPDTAQDLTLAVIFALVGLSMNILVGYTGQLSLGQQGFLGLGALVGANVVSTTGSTRADPWQFAFALIAATVVTGLAALLLGLVALRIQGLYLALLTLVFGSVIASSLFGLASLNGHDSGVAANRPDFLAGESAFYVFCLALLAVVLYLDRRMMAASVGRAFIALRDDERAAQAFGINVTGYKLLAFALSGAIAGLAGGLFAFKAQRFSDKDFTSVAGFTYALTFVIIVVVGGLADRVGAVAAGVFFALLDPLLKALLDATVGDNTYINYKLPIEGIVGSVLLLQTIIFNPGGLGQALRPIRGWLSGGPFTLHHGEADGGLGPVGGVSTRA